MTRPFDLILFDLDGTLIETAPEIADAVNDTLSRTVVTSLSLILTLGILLALGPDVIFGFTAAMFLGILVGTFSSVYVAAPILIWLNVSSDSFVPEGDGKKKGEVPAEGFLK